MDKNLFKQEAKIIVDVLFSSNVFKENITRDDMNATEEFILSMLESRFESYVKLEELAKRIKNKNNPDNK